MEMKNLARIQETLEQYVKENHVAGVNVLLYKDNKEIGYWQAGLADIMSKKAFERDTICRMYSMTKTVTAVAAYKLIEQGKLDLGKPVRDILPEFWEVKVCTDTGRNGKPHPAERPILIQDLLNMTSGYGYGAYWEGSTYGEFLTSDLIEELNDDAAGPCKIITQEFAKKIAQIPLNFEPGTDYQYGFSADILGAVIEKVSGKKFSEFLKENIFDPLGMDDTAFYVPKAKQPRLSKIYKTVQDPNHNGKFANLPFEGCNLGIQYKMDHAPSFESGGAGLCSTIDDFMKFGLMLVNRGNFNGKQLLQGATVDFMSGAELRDNIQQKFNQKMEHLSGYTYCNLLRIAKEPGKCKALTTKGEYGWDGWLGPYLGIDPANNIVLVITMQKVDAGTWELTRCVKNIIYSAIKE
ncbi:MAG: beta-lactamase family protein [Treponema sp.]|nr:beta-lactamase family protein [Treponema sp.]